MQATILESEHSADPMRHNMRVQYKYRLYVSALSCASALHVVVHDQKSMHYHAIMHHSFDHGQQQHTQAKTDLLWQLADDSPLRKTTSACIR